eukprot:PLAT3992.1.p1 GENE.PLAT3992.1~~PLAT3992.1.p1  ORF type:complete len:319 (-),score=77.22 PLAT3992.1:1255-2187(-)
MAACAPVALIIGASRGIGAQLARTFAADGFNLSLLSKTLHASDSKLPGSLTDVREEIAAAQPERDVLLHAVDVRDADRLRGAIEDTLSHFSRLDAVLYNAGAIWWDTVAATPLKRYELMHDINARGAYVATKAALPHLARSPAPSLLYVAPPIYSRFFRGKAAYAMTKVATTVLALGIASDVRRPPVEGRDEPDYSRIRVNTLWPTHGISTAVTDSMHVPASLLRRPAIFADAALAICRSAALPAGPHGETLLDEDFLRRSADCGGRAMTDFSSYSAEEGSQPPRMLPRSIPSLLVEEEEQVFPNLRSKL